MSNQVRDVLQAYDLGELISVRAAGGTASPKYAVETTRGKYLIRVRTTEFADAALIHFDHEILRRLHRAGLPVPVPLQRRDGATWLRLNDDCYEILSWLQGDPFLWENEKALQGLGDFLGRFHEVLGADLPDGKEGWLREDHPKLLTTYPAALEKIACLERQREALKQVDNQIDLIRQRLDAELYAALPHCVIHGDLHPGNVRFHDSEVAALYDFDYLSVQARVRDVCDALMFFAAGRSEPLRTDDIRSLTQPFVPDVERAMIFLHAYEQTRPLSDSEWAALPLLMRSRWIQMRLRGSRKVPDAEKVRFVLDGFFEPIAWLDDQAEDYFVSVRQRISHAHRSGAM